MIRNALSEKGPLTPQLEEYLENASIPTLDTWLRFAFEAGKTAEGKRKADCPAYRRL